MPRAEVRWYSSTTTSPLVVDVDAGQLGVEQVAVGNPSGGHQQHVGLDGLAVVELEHDWSPFRWARRRRSRGCADPTCRPAMSVNG